MKARALRSELARASLLTTMVALLLTAGSLLLYQLWTYRNALVNDAEAQAELIAQSTAAALIFDDKKVAQSNLDLLQVKAPIRAATIFRATGEVFVAYRRQATDENMPARWDVGSDRLGPRFEGALLHFAYPIRSGNERVGTLYLQAEHQMWRQAGSYAGILAAVTALSLSLSFIVFARLQRRVTGPLFKVTEVAQEVMKNRDWSLRAPPSLNLDVSVLVRAFNGMLAEVEGRTNELELSNRRLELETAVRRQAEEELKQLDKRKDEFIATLAHELRNPLAPMMNASALLSLPRADDQVRERAVSILTRQLKHMSRLIDDLLDVSRVVTGKLSLHCERVELNALVQSATEFAEPMFKQRQQQLHFVDGPSCWVWGDDARLTQVFANLLNNASQYTPAGGRVEVYLLREAEQTVVRVSDNGIGIEPEMQWRIFELFEQADKTLGRGNSGLGIGLTLAKQLTQLHAGSLTVQSEGLGKGACFSVALPLAEDTAADAAAPAPAPVVPVALNVLVADDNVDYAQSLAVILEDAGHRVRVVHDGFAAVDAVTREVPDVALLDIGMPGLDGYEVARRLRARHGRAVLRLVAITGWGQASDKAFAADAGFDEHLVKPVPVTDLIAALLPPARALG
jgi:signal transduction histidine kinase/CheY-like chemotaxis protein